MDDTEITEVWREHRRWSTTASRLKKSIVFWRSAALALAIGGAVLATLATQFGTDTTGGLWASALAACVLALVPVIRSTKVSRGAVRTWTRARSASEGLKELVYLHLTWVPSGGADEEARRRRVAELHDGTTAILHAVEDLDGQTLDAAADDTPIPDVTDVDSYIDRRVVRSQIDGYYRPSASREQRRLQLFRGAEFGLGLLGAVLGALAAATRTDALAAWVAVVTTVGAAITAHVAAARYEHHVISYLATARQLRSLVRAWRSSDDRSPEAAARLVHECEDAISRENESWMAAWSRDEGATPAGGA